MCRKTPSVTIKKMSKELKISETEILSVLKELQGSNVLEYVSDKKSGYWKVASYQNKRKSKTKNSSNFTSESKARYGSNIGSKQSIEEKVVKYGNIANEIVNALRINSYATGKEMAIAFSVSQSAIEKNISKLQTAGRLKHHGPTKNGYWEIIE